MQKIISAVEKHTQLILNAERFLWRHPEKGVITFVMTPFFDSF